MRSPCLTHFVVSFAASRGPPPFLSAVGIPCDLGLALGKGHHRCNDSLSQRSACSRPSSLPASVLEGIAKNIDIDGHVKPLPLDAVLCE